MNQDRFGKVRLETDATYDFLTDKTGSHLVVELYATIGGKDYRVYGYGLKKDQLELAYRIVRAWEAKAFGNVLALKPLQSGQGMYASDESKVYAPLGRKLNVDLKRMGF